MQLKAIIHLHPTHFLQFNCTKFFFAILSLLLLSSVSIAQKKVEIVKANSLKFDKTLGDGAKRLIGDVEFKQENTLMFCDSAYFYSNNSLDAFGHVHIQQADSIHLYGDLLNYDGNTKKAIITKNVRVDKADMQLLTDVLNYDVSTSIGYYTNNAKITSKENLLTSVQGYFFAKTNELTFKKNVVLTNPQLVVHCDTMRYNTQTKITYFKGPTTITSKQNIIYCEDGWYDTQKDLSRFSNNSYILTKEQKMFGDSLYYDRKKGIGRAIKNVNIIDTANKIIIQGKLAKYFENEKLSIITGNTLLKKYFDNDTLFLHADTLKARGDKQVADDTKSNQRLYAYKNVRFYKEDIAGNCDSMYYTTIDSAMRLYGNPILWNQQNQLTADSIKINTGQSKLNSIELMHNAFIASQEDSLLFNQVRSKYMKGYFKNNELYLVNAKGNGQTIYFIEDKGAKEAVNRADCSDLNIYIKDRKVDKITFITKPEATIYPLDQISVKELKLKGFSWRANERPLSKEAVFLPSVIKEIVPKP